MTPVEGRVLLDQLEHRWRRPDCPPSLYVVTCTLRAPRHGALVANTGNLVEALLCAKPGSAMHSIAARMKRYITEPLCKLRIGEASQSLPLRSSDSAASDDA
jgi:hypothetical protein